MDDLFDAHMRSVCKCFIENFCVYAQQGVLFYICSFFGKQYKCFLTVAGHHGPSGGYPGPGSKINMTSKPLFLAPVGWEHHSLKQGLWCFGDRVTGVIHKFHVYLHALSLWIGPAQNIGYPSQLDGLHTTRVHDGGDLAESPFLFWIWFRYQGTTSKSEFESILLCLME